MNTTSYLLIQIGFALLTIIFFYLLTRDIFRGVQLTGWTEERKKLFRSRWIAALAIWGVAVSAWSASGMMLRFDLFPLNFAPILVIPLVGILWLTFSSSMKDILFNIPQTSLVRLQVFRLFVEILLWQLFVINLLPIQMSFEGLNFDVLSGVTAPIVALLIAKEKLSKSMLIAWNILCIGLLVNIVTIALLSAPTPLRVFMNDPANTIVAYFPISFLPGFLVPLAYMLHCFSLRKALSESRTVAPVL